MRTVPIRLPAALLLPALLLTACATAPAPVPATPPPATDAQVPAPAAPAPVSLASTEVLKVTTPAGRTYPVWVDLPPSYASQPQRRYPVLYVTDAPWSFPMLHGIRQLMGRDGSRFGEFILVGLAPQEGLSLRDSRSRDYTPTDPRLRDNYTARDYEAPEYGQAAAWRDVLGGQIVPLIDRTYRTAPGRRVYAGHSYGGLFGAYVLLTRPQLFDSYILGSPSLWFDQGEIFRIEQAEASRRTDRAELSLPARVRMVIGAYERPGDGPRYGKEGAHDMVGDVVRFAGLLQGRGYQGLSVDYRVIGGEDHGSVYPAFITDALVWAFPGTNPKYREE